VTANGGSGFVTLDGNVPEALQFDPVSLKVTGRVSLPNRPYDLVSFSPPVMNGSTLYVPSHSPSTAPAMLQKAFPRMV